jgi:RimJ/RimL family protein N-acetyltransferase
MPPVSGIAVQRLHALHRPEIERHLLDLPAEDRRLRFGQAVRDDMIERYVAGVDFGRDRLFGIFGNDLRLIGFGHLALDADGRSAELGLSVCPALRGRGFGAALLERAVLAAANLGYRALFMHCLAENKIMMHLARKAGLSVVVRYGEADAELALDRRRHGGAAREAMADQFALVDYLLKQQYSLLARPATPAAARQPCDRGLKSAAPGESDDERRRAARAAKTPEGEIPSHA